MPYFMDRRGVLDTGAPSHGFQVGIPGGRRRIADAAPAINAVIKHVNDQVLGLQVTQRRQIKQRKQNAAVGIEHDNFPVRQRQSQTYSDAQRAPHHAHEQISFVPGQMRPFDALAALRRYD